MKKYLLCIIIFTSFLSLFFSCDNTTGPPNNNAKLNLTLEDASCTEVWLKLQVDNTALKSDVIIYRDNVEIKKINNIIGNDTIIYDENLLPNKTYTYKAIKIVSEKEVISSKEVVATTMDTTSHNFTFKTFTFGEHSSSVLYDVAIIDENNIWAVGEIYMNDSLGNPDPNAFNCVHWDGKSWQLRRIYFPTVCGSTSITSYPAKSIFAFSDGQIWISSSGDKIAILKDEIQINKFCLPSNVSMSINKIWGSSSNDLYIVGNGGNIAHYQNGVWRKIESGTELNINDIYGSNDKKTNQYEILVTASNILQSLDRDLLKINSNSVNHLLTIPINGTLRTVWFIPNRMYYVAGGGVYQKKSLNDSLWNNDPFEISKYSTNRIRGIDINDITATGGVGELLHFNGFSWHSYIDQTILPNGNYYGLDIKDNIIVSVGQNNPQAVITIGKRNN